MMKEAKKEPLKGQLEIYREAIEKAIDSPDYKLYTIEGKWPNGTFLTEATLAIFLEPKTDHYQFANFGKQPLEVSLAAVMMLGDKKRLEEIDQDIFAESLALLETGFFSHEELKPLAIVSFLRTASRGKSTSVHLYYPAILSPETTFRMVYEIIKGDNLQAN